jgi:hypothetical protein
VRWRIRFWRPRSSRRLQRSSSRRALTRVAAKQPACASSVAALGHACGSPSVIVLEPPQDDMLDAVRPNRAEALAGGAFGNEVSRSRVASKAPRVPRSASGHDRSAGHRGLDRRRARSQRSHRRAREYGSRRWTQRLDPCQELGLDGVRVHGRGRRCIGAHGQWRNTPSGLDAGIAWMRARIAAYGRPDHHLLLAPSAGCSLDSRRAWRGQELHPTISLLYKEATARTSCPLRGVSPTSPRSLAHESSCDPISIVARSSAVRICLAWKA